jgi:hypothetical protein
MNLHVLKAFVYDAATSITTAGAAWLTVPANVEKLGFTHFLIPVIVGLAGGAAMAIRRYRIAKKAA